MSTFATDMATFAKKIDTNSIRTRLVCKIIEWVSLPVFVAVWFWRHKSILNIIKWAAILSFLIIEFFGLAALIGLVTMMGRFAFAAIFMIAQFAFLFMFLSSTKNIETVPGDKGEISFEKDYFGNESLVSAIRQWVSLMTKEGRDKAKAIGAESINGILLQGPPGTGKTLLARALATDSFAAFIGLDASSLQAMFIGVGPMKVMGVYRKARKRARMYGGCIVFIDEIDAIGGNRGGVVGKDQPVAGGMAGGMFGGGGLGVLSKLLNELDGVKEIPPRDQIQNKMRSKFGIEPIDQGVVLTMAATNRPDALDPALTRPGRIDKKILIGYPDKLSRKQIIEGYLNKVKHDDSVDVDGLVADLQGVTPATIASAIQRGAARFAINADRNYIVQADILSALEEDIVGLSNPIQGLEEEQEYQIAVHESGHAVISATLRPWQRITNVSIIRRGSGILGYIRGVETEEVYSMPLHRMAATIQVLLAGHVATELVLNEPWTGASEDIKHVQRMMYSMAMHGQFGAIPFKAEDPFEHEEIKFQANEYLIKATEGTRTLLEENKELLLHIADELIEHKELSSKEFYSIVGDANEHSE